MKHKAIARLVIAVLFAGSLPSHVLAEEKPMHPSLEKLDLNGDMVLLLDTSTLEQRILEYTDKMSVLIQEAMNTASSAEEIQAINTGVEKFKTAIEWSGLLSMKSFAMSMAPAEGALTRVISLAQHSEADADKPIWRMLASEPKVLKGIGYVPKNAVYVANSTTRLDEVWKVVNEAVAKFGGPQSAVAFGQQVAMAEMLLGTNVAAIVGSINHETLVSIQLSEDKQIVIPQGTGTVTCPEPSLLIGFQTKEPLLGNILIGKLAQFQIPTMQTTNGVNILHTLNLPLPAPFPVTPTLVMTEDYLLIGSTREVIVEALEAQAKGTGLVATPLYKNLLGTAPEKTSGIEFVSPRFMQTYIQIFSQAMDSQQNEEMKPVMDMMLSHYENMCVGSYSLKTPTGLFSLGYADYGGAKPIEIAISSYVGMMAAIAIPAAEKSRSGSQEAVCRNNCRILNAAIEQWAMENEQVDGAAVTEADITEYIKGGFPALQCPKGGSYIVSPVGTDPECSVHGSL